MSKQCKCGILAKTCTYHSDVYTSMTLVEQEISLGQPCDVYESSQPDHEFRPSRVETNIPCSKFMTATSLVFTNICILHTADVYTASYTQSPPDIDMYDFCTYGRGRKIFPTNPNKCYAGDFFPEEPLLVKPVHRIYIKGRYTGLVPPGYKFGDNFKIRFTFHE